MVNVRKKSVPLMFIVMGSCGKVVRRRSHFEQSKSGCRQDARKRKHRVILGNISIEWNIVSISEVMVGFIIHFFEKERNIEISQRSSSMFHAVFSAPPTAFPCRISS